MNPLLTTKLYVPVPRPALVSRRRLTNLLEQGLRMGGRLGLIAAPAGFGKTTLLSEWVACRQQPVAWISLDDGDNEPLRFLTYLIASLQTCIGGVGEPVQALMQGAQVPPLESLLVMLLNELAILPEPIVLVLDDYHVIQNQTIHDALLYLLDHLPPHIHLVIASRADPPLPLARLRVRGQLVELRSADLRFTAEEAAQFLNQAMGLALSPDDVDRLESRTEGWIAGLQLAALSMQRRSDVRSFIESFAGSHRYVLGYLAEEVLAQQSNEVQTFLLRTSILDRLCADLCDAVLHGGGNAAQHAGDEVRSAGLAQHRIASSSQSILEELERRNLFLVPLDDEQRWYRYHHLFAEVLRHRLQQTTPEDVALLHRRASVWYEQNGYPAEAVAHAFAGEDMEWAANLAQQAAAAIFLPRHVDSLMGWIRRLPEAYIRPRPQLSLFHAWSLLHIGDYQGCEQRLQDVEHALGNIDPVHESEFLGMVAALRTMLAGIHGDRAQAQHHSEAALRNLPEDALQWRCVAVAYLGTASALNGDVAAARRDYRAALPAAESAGDRYERLIIEWRLARLLHMEGHLRQAEKAFSRVLAEAEQIGMAQLPAPGYARLDLAAVLLEQNKRAQARRHLAEGIGQIEKAGSAVILLEGYLTLAQLERVERNLAAAEDALHQGFGLVQRGQVPAIVANRLYAYQAEVLLVRGEQEAAQRWAEQHRRPFDPSIWFAEEAIHLARAKVLLALNQGEEARRLLYHLYDVAERRNLGDSLIRISTWLAVACHALGETEKAAQTLGQVLSHAVPEGYMRTFVEGGVAVAKVLAEVIRQDGKGAAQARALLVAFNEEIPPQERPAPISGENATPAPGETAPSEIAQWLVEPLSDREREVLALVAKGLTNREIGDRLIISAATVKKHVENIRGKLYVSNRTEAVTRARELDLI